MLNEVHYQAQQAGRANWLPVGAILFHVRTDFAHKQWCQKVQETQSGLIQRLKTNKTQYVQVAVIPYSKWVSLFKQLFLTSNFQRIPFTRNTFILQEEGSLLTILPPQKCLAHPKQEHRVLSTAFLLFFSFLFLWHLWDLKKKPTPSGRVRTCRVQTRLCKPGLEQNMHCSIQVMGTLWS